jgi:hypothetical protein
VACCKCRPSRKVCKNSIPLLPAVSHFARSTLNPYIQVCVALAFSSIDTQFLYPSLCCARLSLNRHSILISPHRLPLARSTLNPYIPIKLTFCSIDTQSFCPPIICLLLDRHSILIPPFMLAFRSIDTQSLYSRGPSSSPFPRSTLNPYTPPPPMLAFRLINSQSL